MINVKHLIGALILVLLGIESKAQYTISTDFGSLARCDTMTRGPFCVWWDKHYSVPRDVPSFLDSLVKFRAVCIDDLDLRDPVNISKGHYINVYLHYSGDVFPNWFHSIATQKDSRGNIYAAVPVGLHLRFSTMAYVSFYLFQDNHSSTGFDYSLDGQ